MCFIRGFQTSFSPAVRLLQWRSFASLQLWLTSDLIWLPTKSLCPGANVNCSALNQSIQSLSCSFAICLLNARNPKFSDSTSFCNSSEACHSLAAEMKTAKNSYRWTLELLSCTRYVASFSHGFHHHLQPRLSWPYGRLSRKHWKSRPLCHSSKFHGQRPAPGTLLSS